MGDLNNCGRHLPVDRDDHDSVFHRLYPEELYRPHCRNLELRRVFNARLESGHIQCPIDEGCVNLPAHRHRSQRCVTLASSAVSTSPAAASFAAHTEPAALAATSLAAPTEPAALAATCIASPTLAASLAAASVAATGTSAVFADHIRGQS